MKRNTIEGLRPRASVVVLLLATSALAALNCRLLTMTIDISPAGVGGGAGPLESVTEAAAVAPFEPKPLSSFPETEARSLFSPTRRPPPASAQTAAPARALPDLRLVGVMMIAPAQKRALIRSPLAPRGRWIAEGGQVDEWNVLSIGADAVVITGHGGRHELKLPRPGTDRGVKP